MTTINPDCLRCDAGPLELQCMDIWGGTNAANQQFSTPGLDVHVISQPFKDHAQGGDIYYISLCGSGNIARLAVADVSGHGDQAAHIASHLRTLMRKNINTPNQSRFAQSLNEQFGRIATAGTFATAVLATYWAPTDHLILVNAGHPPPLLYRAADDRWLALTSDTNDIITTPTADIGIRNLPLGILEPTGYDQFAVKLEPADLVVLHTDALMEAKDAAGRQLGMQGLIRVATEAKGSQPEDFAHRLIQGVQDYSAHTQPDDDRTVLLLHHNAANPPRMTAKQTVRTLGRMIGVIPQTTA